MKQNAKHQIQIKTSFILFTAAMRHHSSLTVSHRYADRILPITTAKRPSLLYYFMWIFERAAMTTGFTVQQETTPPGMG